MLDKGTSINEKLIGLIQKSAIFFGMVFLLVAVVIYCHELSKTNSKPNNLADRGQILFSVDDASEIFLDIYSQNPESIFDNETLNHLSKFHETYDMDVILYVYEIYDGFNLKSFPMKYKKEFQDNSDWLRIGFHGLNECNPFEGEYSDDEIYESFLRVNSDIAIWAGKESISDMLRLHYWYGTFKLINNMAGKGVKSIFYIDRDDQCGYDFSKEEDSCLRSSDNGIVRKSYPNGTIDYLLTDIRLENESNVLCRLRDSDELIVVFTHAWCFDENIQKLDDVCKWGKKHGYSLNYF